MSKRVTRWLLILPVLVAWAMGADAQQTGQILGQLVDERSGQPVAGAQILLAGTALQTTTDDDGIFRLRNIPPGTYRLQVNHIAFGPRSVDAAVEAGRSLNLKITLTETAITLAPLTVEAISAAERQTRSAGFARSMVTREQIARAENTNMTLSEILRTEVPSIRVRRLERIPGQPVCIEFRQVRVLQQASCLSPAVYLDGALVTNPTGLYDNLDLSMIESLEVIPLSEAGVRFGYGALHGALLIQTRRPGSASEEVRGVRQRHNFDWKQEPRGHRTPLVFVSTVAGNAAGAALGYAVARQCLHLRTPGNDGIVSDCSLLPTLGSGLAALFLPAVSSGLVSRLVGQTENSRGQFMPAAVGAAMAILPGYALAVSAKRNNDQSQATVGYVLIAVGAPFITTASDYLFRKLKK
ncbi:MAG: carboxypeptidase regulatory-like domain-containing protein [Longimicrobiales bacterium]